MSSVKGHAGGLVGRILLLDELLSVPVTPVAAYLFGLTLGLDSEQASWALLVALPPVILVVGLGVPFAAIRLLVGRAFARNPGEPPEARLNRLLELPWRITLGALQIGWVLGGMAFSLLVCVSFNKEPGLVLVGGGIGLCVSTLLSLPMGLTIERWLLPHVLEARDELGQVPPSGGHGFFRPRQSWFLPATFAASLISTLLLCGIVVMTKTTGFQARLVGEMRSIGELRAAQRLEGLTAALIADLGLPLLLVAGMLLCLPTLSAWMLARRQERGAKAVMHAIAQLSTGRLMMPQWVSTDEIGDLAQGLHEVLKQLRAIPLTLQQSATQLVEAGASLGAANQEQRNSLSSQAAALQETHVTAQEIKQTSELAARRAEDVLTLVNRAEELGRTGSAAVEETLVDFSAVRESVVRVREKMSRLEASARQIGGIVGRVKGLADRSNMLAINAAIEAVRSGEHGKGFGVVAREIRALADQSIRATGDIQTILEEIDSAIREAAAMSDDGAQQMETSLAKVKSSGASIQQLSGIVGENAAAVRQITAVVSQQNVGFNQIFTALSQLSRNMEHTVARLDTTLEAATSLERISSQVSAVAQQYQPQRDEPTAEARARASR
jgi:methyl-accepting chemotaxis protein